VRRYDPVDYQFAFGDLRSLDSDVRSRCRSEAGRQSRGNCQWFHVHLRPEGPLPLGDDLGGTNRCLIVIRREYSYSHFFL
jgi:hypothetical protein